ncbi:MAG: tetratricopeptide repeat protein [Syntrophaceae bacterium]|nr:tetratricopeptide repeat protein [Syntrophaceae bacterium]
MKPLGNKQKATIAKLIIPIAIMILTIVAYSDVRYHQFLNIDDKEYVSANRNVQKGVTPESVQWAFGFTGIAYYHPLTWISHMLDYQMYGLAPGKHHLTNLIIHILNALLLYWLILRMTGAPYASGAVALLFAVHPIQIESVAWVTERKNLLSTLFLLISIHAYIRYVKDKSILIYFGVLILFVLGLLSKPSILSFPFLLLILDYWPLKRFSAAMMSRIDNGQDKIQRISIHSIIRVVKSRMFVFVVAEKIPFVVLSLISSYLSLISMSSIVIDHNRIPLDLRIYNLFVSIIKYLKNYFWPFDYAIYYPFPGNIPLSYFLLSLSGIIIITIAAIFLRRNRPWLTVGWLWFLVALAPAGGLVQAGLWPEMANRFMYIPMIGLSLLLVWECNALLKGRYSTVLKYVIFLTILALMIPITRTQNLYFSNGYALFTRALAVTGPNCIAYNGIGDALYNLGHKDEAEEYFRKAIEANPMYELAQNNYGLCLTRKGDYKNAAKYYTQAISINPMFLPAYLNYGFNEYQQGNLEEAKKLLEHALLIDPHSSATHNTYGAVLLKLGNKEGAIRHYQLAVEYGPNDIQARINLSIMYENTGRYDQSLAEYRKIYEMGTLDRGITAFRIAGVFARQQRFEECKSYLILAMKNGFDVKNKINDDDRFNNFRISRYYKELF